MKPAQFALCLLLPLLILHFVKANTYCLGKLSTDPTVCSGNGTCTVDGCKCYNGYGGEGCDLFACNGILANETSVCNSHGICDGPNHCSCTSGAFGPNCTIFYCNGYASNEDYVCSNRGNCAGTEKCECFSGYTGSNCQYVSCGVNKYQSNDPKVCSSRGKCTGPNTCKCDTGYYGSECEITSCSGIESNNTSVCSGKGNCTQLNNCVCNSGYGGTNCQYPKCSGILSTSGTVCSGKGKCVASEVCDCVMGYGGSNCEKYVTTQCKGNYLLGIDGSYTISLVDTSCNKFVASSSIFSPRMLADKCVKSYVYEDILYQLNEGNGGLLYATKLSLNQDSFTRVDLNLTLSGPFTNLYYSKVFNRLVILETLEDNSFVVHSFSNSVLTKIGKVSDRLALTNRGVDCVFTSITNADILKCLVTEKTFQNRFYIEVAISSQTLNIQNEKTLPSSLLSGKLFLFSGSNEVRIAKRASDTLVSFFAVQDNINYISQLSFTLDEITEIANEVLFHDTTNRKLISIPKTSALSSLASLKAIDFSLFTGSGNICRTFIKRYNPFLESINPSTSVLEGGVPMKLVGKDLLIGSWSRVSFYYNQFRTTSRLSTCSSINANTSRAYGEEACFSSPPGGLESKNVIIEHNIEGNILSSSLQISSVYNQVLRVSPNAGTYGTNVVVYATFVHPYDQSRCKFVLPKTGETVVVKGTLENGGILCTLPNYNITGGSERVIVKISNDNGLTFTDSDIGITYLFDKKVQYYVGFDSLNTVTNYFSSGTYVPDYSGTPTLNVVVNDGIVSLKTSSYFSRDSVTDKRRSIITKDTTLLYDRQVYSDFIIDSNSDGGNVFELWMVDDGGNFVMGQISVFGEDEEPRIQVYHNLTTDYLTSTKQSQLEKERVRCSSLKKGVLYRLLIRLVAPIDIETNPNAVWQSQAILYRGGSGTEVLCSTYQLSTLTKMTYIKYIQDRKYNVALSQSPIPELLTSNLKLNISTIVRNLGIECQSSNCNPTLITESNFSLTTIIIAAAVPSGVSIIVIVLLFIIVCVCCCLRRKNDNTKVLEEKEVQLRNNFNKLQELRAQNFPPNNNKASLERTYSIGRKQFSTYNNDILRDTPTVP